MSEQFTPLSGKRTNGKNPAEHRRQSMDSMMDTSQLSEYLSCEIESSADLEVFQ